MSKHDLVLFLWLNAYVIALIIGTEILTFKKLLSEANARKALHILVGNVVFFLPFFEDWKVVVSVPAIYVVANFLLSPHSPIEKLRLKTFEAGHSLGTVYYPISLLFLVIFLWEDPFGVMISFLPLAYGDGMAAVVGIKKPIRQFKAVGGTKSVGGSLAFLIFSLISVAVATFISLQNMSLVLPLIVSIIALLVELISPKGTDNLFIPISVSLIYKFFL